MTSNLPPGMSENHPVFLEPERCPACKGRGRTQWQDEHEDCDVCWGAGTVGTIDPDEFEMDHRDYYTEERDQGFEEED